MLHELIHIEIAEHSAKFYALLDVLHNEANAVVDDGASASGGISTMPSSSSVPPKFPGTGQAVGRCSRARADREQSLNVLSVRPGAKRRRLCADAALLRWKNSSSSSASASSSATERPSLSSATLQKSENEEELSCGQCDVFRFREGDDGDGDDDAHNGGGASGGYWACSSCTLLNEVTRSSCRLCGGERVPQPKQRMIHETADNVIVISDDDD